MSAQLNTKESKIVGMLVSGHRNVEIATELGITPKHLHVIEHGMYKKFGVRHMIELVHVLHVTGVLGGKGTEYEALVSLEGEVPGCDPIHLPGLQYAIDKLGQTCEDHD